MADDRLGRAEKRVWECFRQEEPSREGGEKLGEGQKLIARTGSEGRIIS